MYDHTAFVKGKLMVRWRYLNIRGDILQANLLVKRWKIGNPCWAQLASCPCETLSSRFIALVGFSGFVFSMRKDATSGSAHWR